MSDPFSFIQELISSKSKAAILCRNDCLIVARVRAYDKHLNLVLEDAVEIKSKKLVESQKSGSKTRDFKRLFVRGDGIVSVFDFEKSSLAKKLTSSVDLTVSETKRTKVGV